MVDKNKQHLEKLVQTQVTKMFESILDYSQIAVPDPNTFKALRSKILRSGNDCIRSITGKFSEYDIKYIPKNEDIIIFNNDK